MATKKQKRAAALAKREKFLANERERNAKTLQRARAKRQAELESAKRKVADRAKRERASKAAKAMVETVSTLPS